MSALQRQVGPVMFADVGVEVWSAQRSREVVAGVDKVGGVVLAVTEKMIGDENGEPVAERSFLVVDPYNLRPRLRFAHLAESEVDLEVLKAPETSTLVRLGRRIAEAIAFVDGYTRRTGRAFPEEGQLSLAVHVVYGLIFGPGGDLYGELAPLAMGAPSTARRSYPVNASAFVD